MRHVFCPRSSRSAQGALRSRHQFSHLSAKTSSTLNPASREEKAAYQWRKTLRNGREKLLENLIERFEQKHIDKAPKPSPPLVIRMSQAINDRAAKRTRSHLQFITTPTADTPGTALLLHFDDKRYVIGNVHEGLQRAGLQMGAGIFKAKDFLITGKTEWRSTGGLLGMILTVADAVGASTASKNENAKEKLRRQREREEAEARQKSRKPRKKGNEDAATRVSAVPPVLEDPTLTLHGGPNLTHTVATARSFIFRNGHPVKVKENLGGESSRGQDRNGDPTWEDERIQVWALTVSPTRTDDAPSPSSPRKRSLGEYMKGMDNNSLDPDDQWSVHPVKPADQERRDQRLREFVLTEMFNSTWRHDNLVETPLHQVKMPAALFVRDRRTNNLVRYTGPVPDGTTPVPNINVLVRQPWPGALVDHLPPAQPSSIAMSYIIRNHEQRGKFKADAAREAKVPAGPLWKILAEGGEVQSSDGKTITPEMVLEPSTVGSGVVVVDLPSKDYVTSLINRPEWNNEKIMAGVRAFIWILGPGVSEDADLRRFIGSKPDLQHIISSPDHCPNYLVQMSAATAAVRHHQIDPIRFPIPVHSNIPPVSLSLTSDEASQSTEQPLQNLHIAKRGLKISLEPSFGINEKEIIPALNTAQIIKETPNEVVKMGNIAQQRIQSRSLPTDTADQGLPSQDAEIFCLGTGSALPSLYRNVSGTLLRVPGRGSYLFDCGENTLGQLKRMFPADELAEVLRDLKCIWISHLHADHHLGTARVIKAWYLEVHGKEPSKKAPVSLTEQLLDPAKILEEEKRLFIFGHRYMMRWLEEYSSVEDFGYNHLVPVVSFPTHWSRPNTCYLEWNGLEVGFNSAKDPKVRAAIRKATGLSNLVSAPVSHCYGSQAVSMTFPDGFKVSYSGDCRPSKEFVAIGKGSTVLIHEATFDDQLIGDAMAKKHSTTSEAIGVGMAMGARRLILTHFSQRYTRLPSTGSMDRVTVRFEDGDKAEDPMDGMEPPVNVEDQPSVDVEPSTVQTSETPLSKDPQDAVDEGSAASSKSASAAEPLFDSLNSMTNMLQSVKNDMKIGVAFDYMRVKVGDIIHLEKLNPALRELYKNVEQEEISMKAKKAARQASSDDLKKMKSAKVVTPAKGEEDKSVPKTKESQTAAKAIPPASEGKIEAIKEPQAS